jgi:hypothetical protein
VEVDGGNDGLWKARKSLTSNAGLAKSRTKTLRTRSNHVFLALCATFKLECLNIKKKLSSRVVGND